MCWSCAALMGVSSEHLARPILPTRAYLERGNRKRLALLIQGDVGEEGGDSAVIPLVRLHQVVRIHKHLNLHGLVTGEGHPARDSQNAAWRQET